MVSMPASRTQGKSELCERPMLASVLQMFATDDSLPAKRRADVCSGVRSLCRAAGLPLESTPADPRHVADKLAGVTPTTARMTKRRFQNCRSHLDAVLEYVGALANRRRNRSTMTLDYRALLAQITDGWKRKKITRFFGVMSSLGITSDHVDNSAFDAYLDALENSTLKDFRTIDREARSIWNEMKQMVPGWPGQVVSVPRYTDHYTLPEEAFPDSFWRDLDRYLDSRRRKAPSDLDELLTDAELLGEAEDGHKPIRASTAKLIRYRVLQFASALVIEGVMRAEEISALEILVRPKIVSDGLKFFIRRVGGERRNAQIRGIASDLYVMAKLWVRSPEPDLKKLGSICGKVRRRPDGLPESARRSLAPFADPKTCARSCCFRSGS
jgi:hypothetical protein